MNAFTDLFIRRPVLATVVSLLILLVGGLAALQASGSAVSRDLEHHDHHHHDLSGRCGRRHQGLHHDPDRAGGGERRGHRHAGLDLAAEHLDHHAQSASRRQSRPGDGRHACPRSIRCAALLPRDANDPVVVKQTGQGFALMYLSFNSEVMTAVADHRLSDPRRPAAPADGRRRRQRPDSRRPDLRHAHLARPDAHGLARRHRRTTCGRRSPPTTSPPPPAR